MWLLVSNDKNILLKVTMSIANRFTDQPSLRNPFSSKLKPKRRTLDRERDVATDNRLELKSVHVHRPKWLNLWIAFKLPRNRGAFFSVISSHLLSSANGEREVILLKHRATKNLVTAYLIVALLGFAWLRLSVSPNPSYIHSRYSILLLIDGFSLNIDQNKRISAFLTLST